MGMLRHCFSVVIVSSVGVVSPAFADDPACAPRYVNEYAEANPQTGACTTLEREVAERKIGGVNPFLVMFESVDAWWSYPGGQSSVRFKQGSPLKFVVRVSSTEVDPQSYVQFFRLDTKDNARIIPILSVGGFSQTVDNKLAHYVVPFDADPVGDHFYVVQPHEPLPPGEYTLSAPKTNANFMFGIDP
jgi:hypothetical protein